jgi:hypothetical protein
MNCRPVGALICLHGIDQRLTPLAVNCRRVAAYESEELLNGAVTRLFAGSAPQFVPGYRSR